jgi:hypothetical protein
VSRHTVHNRRWATLRARKLKANPYCEDPCCTEQATEVDHIQPQSEALELLGCDGHRAKERCAMTRKKAAEANAPATVAANEPEDQNYALKIIGGSECNDWNNTLANQTIRALWIEHSDAEACDRQQSATIAALVGIGPSDELEGMMAAQLIAAHNAAMECYRRAMLGEQTFEGRRENLNQANKLSRTWAIHVHQGGQAIVGNIETARGVGATPKTEERPHAKPLAHAPEPTLPCPDPEREAVPIARREGQAALPHAWRCDGQRRSTR